MLNQIAKELMDYINTTHSYIADGYTLEEAVEDVKGSRKEIAAFLADDVEAFTDGGLDAEAAEAGQLLDKIVALG